MTFHAHVRVHVPRRLDDEQRTLVEQLGEALGEEPYRDDDEETAASSGGSRTPSADDDGHPFEEKEDAVVLEVVPSRVGMTAGIVRVSVRVPVATAEEAWALALDLAPGGFEESDDGESLTLSLYVDESDVASIAAAFSEVEVTPVEPGWEDAWRAFHKPARVGGLWIGPPWEQPDPGERAVVIDPGRAFGTGAHPTTRLCVELLARSERGLAPRRRLRLGSPLDRCCAARLRSDRRRRQRPRRGRDDDRKSPRSTGSRSRLALLDGEVDELPAIATTVANVLLAPVERILARLGSGVVITSGYLDSDHPTAPGWRSTDRVMLDGWAADRFDARSLAARLVVSFAERHDRVANPDRSAPEDVGAQAAPTNERPQNARGRERLQVRARLRETAPDAFDFADPEPPVDERVEADPAGDDVPPRLFPGDLDPVRAHRVERLGLDERQLVAASRAGERPRAGIAYRSPRRPLPATARASSTRTSAAVAAGATRSAATAPFASGAAPYGEEGARPRSNGAIATASTIESLPTKHPRQIEHGAGGRTEHEHGVAPTVRTDSRSRSSIRATRTSPDRRPARGRGSARQASGARRCSASILGQRKLVDREAERAREARTKRGLRSDHPVRVVARRSPIHSLPSNVYALRPMTTFTTRFLGCKVSFADEQAIRERLLSDGHTEARDGRCRGHQHLLRDERSGGEIAAGCGAGCAGLTLAST